jgi:hypothetical protein
MRSPILRALLAATGLVFLASSYAVEAGTSLPAPEYEAVIPDGGGSTDDSPPAPPGLLDLPPARAQPIVLGMAGSIGLAGGLSLTALGIYGLTQDFQRGFAASAVQRDLLGIASGIVISSVFSTCLGAILEERAPR